MKKVLFILAVVAFFTACGTSGEGSNVTTDSTTVDSVTVDSVVVDTTVKK